MSTDTELYKHAERELDKLVELERVGNLTRPIEELEKEVEEFNGKTPQEFINGEILKVVSVIDPRIHSVKSAPYVLEMAYRLVQLENILPLTLDDEEFIEVAREGDEVIYQNTRNIKVFKTSSRGAYHIDGKASLDIAAGIFEEPQSADTVEGDQSGTDK